MQSEEKILAELKEIKKDLNYIKEHMVDSDTILTPEEKKRLDESLKDFREGKTVSLEDFEKDLHQHIHLENNILFPKAVQLESAAA